MTSFHYMIFGCACVALAACASSAPPSAVVASAPPAPVSAPVSPALSAAPVPIVSTPALSVSDMNARLTAAEGRISGLQGQVVKLEQKLMIARQNMADTAVAFSVLDADGEMPPPAVQEKGKSAVKSAPVSKPILVKTKKPTPKKPSPKPTLRPEPKPVAGGPVWNAVPVKEAPASTDSGLPPPSDAPAPSSALPSVTSAGGAPAETGAALPALMDVRVGDSGGKTRLVIETTQQTPFKIDLDNAEKILMVETSALTVKAPTQGAFANSPLVAAYGVQTGTDGKTHVVVQLRTGVKIESSDALPPAQGKGNRIVLDLVPVPTGH